jgi:hypothetical protein
MDIQKITESLSPIERKILPFLEEQKIIDTVNHFKYWF